MYSSPLRRPKWSTAAEWLSPVPPLVADHRRPRGRLRPVRTDASRERSTTCAARRVRDDDVHRAGDRACERDLAGTGGPDGRARRRSKSTPRWPGPYAMRRVGAHGRTTAPVDRPAPTPAGTTSARARPREREEHDRTEGAHTTRHAARQPVAALAPTRELPGARQMRDEHDSGSAGGSNGTVAGVRPEVHTRFPMLRTNVSGRTSPTSRRMLGRAATLAVIARMLPTS